MTAPAKEAVAEPLLVVGPSDAPDRYRLVERRSAGGEGEVWLATETHAGVTFRYAVKMLHTGLGGIDGHWLEQLRLQAALLTQLEHPALVKVREVFVGAAPHAPDTEPEASARLYLVMKWIDGMSLQEAISAGTLTGLDALGPLGQIADALDYLHSGRDSEGQPVLHRDIKPANILLAADGRAYLVDFGLVRFAGDGATSRISGTVPLMAPESVRYGVYTPASDRYTLGATVYTILAGEPPLPGAVDYLTGRLRSRLPAEAAWLINPILAMLDLDPQRRPADAAVWLGELTTAAGVTRQAASGVAAGGRLSFRHLMVVAAVLVGLLLAGAAGYAARRLIDAAPPRSAITLISQAIALPQWTEKHG